MDILGDGGKVYQVAVALALAIGFFLLSYLASPRKTVPWLVCLSPIPLIDSPYTTSSVLITYVVAVGFFMRGRIKFLPMLGFFLIILGVYIAATGFSHRSEHSQHFIYLFNFVSAILMFLIVYNFVREVKDLNLVIRMLVITNLLVVTYSIVQIYAGPDYAPFGIQELALKSARQGDDPRLAGPFGPGIAAEHFVITILILAYASLHATSIAKRNVIYFLMALNLGCLIATANRGGFLTLIGGAGLFLYMFRGDLGVKRTLSLSIAGVFLLGISSIVVMTYTDYGRMFDRLGETELEGGVPDTRTKTWAAVLPEIAKRPILGHGPMFQVEGRSPTRSQTRVNLQYPHSLYLYLLYTSGVIGLSVYLFFFASLVRRFSAGLKSASADDPFGRGFVRLGIIIVVVFLIDQVKVEFLRITYTGYWLYIFALFAALLGFADLLRRGETTRQAVPSVDPHDVAHAIPHRSAY